MLFCTELSIKKVIEVDSTCFSGGNFKVAPRNYSSLSFRISGNATVFSKGKSYSVNPGDILYVPQNTPYEVEYSDSEIIVFHFITENNNDEIEVYSPENCENIYKTFLCALGIFKNKSPGHKAYMTARFYDLLGMIAEQKTTTELPENFKEAVSFINLNFKDNTLSIDRVCKEAHISPTVFRSYFRRFFSKTPTEYLTDLRLTAARGFISGGMNIEEAAYKSGFNDPKYFARVVKKQFGHSPKGFKNYGK